MDNAVEESFKKNIKHLGSFQKDYKAGKLPKQIVDNTSAKK